MGDMGFARFGRRIADALKISARFLTRVGTEGA